MNLDIPTINSRMVSSVQKREVMWNIIEPGDPFDIRKYIYFHSGPWLPNCPDKKTLWETIFS